jgi:SecD/SecF fusion protein
MLAQITSSAAAPTEPTAGGAIAPVVEAVTPAVEAVAPAAETAAPSVDAAVTEAAQPTLDAAAQAATDTANAAGTAVAEAAAPVAEPFQMTDFLDQLMANNLFIVFYGLVLLALFGWYFATEHEKRKRDVGTALTVLICLLCGMAITPISKKLKGAIDIVGGSSFIMLVEPSLDENGDTQAVTKADTESAMAIIGERLDAFGVAEPNIYRLGENRFVVQMPGSTKDEATRVKTILTRAAKLDLHLVHRESESIVDQVKSREKTVIGFKAFPYKHKVAEGTPNEKEVEESILLKRSPAVFGSNIKFAQAQQGGIVAIELDSDGEDKMYAFTSGLTAGVDRMAIVLDGVAISAPGFKQVPLGKSFIIDGLNGKDEAVELAKDLKNPLKNGLTIDSEQTVSPSMGAAVVHRGVMAGIFGFIATFLFILIYYRSAGLIALIGLLINTLMLFGLMAMFGFRFSLSGIAGTVLTIGMAVDANVLIYERLREELAAGKSVKIALGLAYEKAFTAIFDSNFTSLITSVVLFAIASGSIKGFAITLSIGLISSMFSSILVTRVLFRWADKFHILKSFKFLDLIKATKFDFLGKSRAAAIVSGLFVLASVVVFAIKRDKALSIDFTGGTQFAYEIKTESKASKSAVDELLAGLKLSKAVTTQESSAPGALTQLTVQCATEDSDTVTGAITAAYPELSVPSKDDVSARMGKEFLLESGQALLLGLLLIFLYVAIRYRMAFAVGALIALVHDCLICVGFIAIIGQQLSIIHVAAILTIAGYSINDTVIIFDRIRDNLRTGVGSLQEIMNEAINATLSRTILTSSATLFTVASLYVYGNEEMCRFALMILVGIVVGTYSSIFVASSLVLWWARVTKTNYVELEQSDKAQRPEIVA